MGAMATILVLAGFEPSQPVKQSSFRLEAEPFRMEVLKEIHANHTDYRQKEAMLLDEDIESNYRYHGEISFLRQAYWEQQDKLKGLLAYLNNRQQGQWRQDSLYLSRELKKYENRNNFLNDRFVLLNKRIK